MYKRNVPRINVFFAAQRFQATLAVLPEYFIHFFQHDVHWTGINRYDTMNGQTAIITRNAKFRNNKTYLQMHDYCVIIK